MMFSRFTCVFLLLACFSSSCLTSRSQYTPEGTEIPGKKVFDPRAYTYLCEPVFAKNIKEIEAALNGFGRSGWQLAGFLSKDGNSYAYCFYR